MYCWRRIAAILALQVAACGGSHDYGSTGGELTDEQLLLLELEGAWSGTAEDLETVSGSTRIALVMELPADGEPALTGLTGTVVLGEEGAGYEVDPEDPEDGHAGEAVADGHVLALEHMAIVGGRLLGELRPVTKQTLFCASQTSTYELAPGEHRCSPPVPGWTGECGPGVSGPNGEDCVYWGPEGKEVFVHDSKVEYCDECTCSSTSCSHEGPQVELDLAVDTDAGVLIGTGDLGRIEAARVEVH